MRARLWLGGILLLVVGFLLGWGVRPAPATAPTVAPPAVNVDVTATPARRTASLMLDFGDGNVRTYADVDITGAKTVFDVLKGLSESGNGFVLKYEPPGQYGILIDQIGNKKGGDDGGKYWLYWVNDAEAQASADNTAVHPGDVIEWKFINMQATAGGAQ